MEKKIRPWVAWMLPVFISVGMAFGSFIGFSSFGINHPQFESVSEADGAAGALLILITVIVGFFMSLITVIVAKIRHHKEWNYIFVRIGLVIIGGGIIGALAPNQETASIVFVCLLLLCFPIVCSWPWQKKTTNQ